MNLEPLPLPPARKATPREVCFVMAAISALATMANEASHPYWGWSYFAVAGCLCFLLLYAIVRWFLDNP